MHEGEEVRENPRLDAILRRAIPPSYNTRRKRLNRAIEALLSLKGSDGERVFSRKQAFARLDIPEGAIAAPLIATIQAGLRAARTESGRKAERASKKSKKKTRDMDKNFLTQCDSPKIPATLTTRP